VFREAGRTIGRVHLLYLDESGKSGPQDFKQPWYVLGGLIVHEASWQAMERALNVEIDRLVPPPRPDKWEVHMAHIFHRKGNFAGMPKATRFGLVDAVFDVVDRFGATLIIVGVDKKAHAGRYRYPAPVEDQAYKLMLERFNTYVGRQTDKLGVVVCDEQKEMEAPTRRAHSRYRRIGTGMAVIDHVIETPFFTPSHWSRMLQMIDVVTYYVALHLRGARAFYWPRIERRLDGYPNYVGKGLKTFP
jgi:hypothetical protein